MKKVKIEVRDIPSLSFTLKADRKIRSMVKHHNKYEVMFHLLVKRLDKLTYQVYDIYYPPQKIMRGTFCEVADDGDTRLFYYLMANGRVDEWGNAKGLCHSHVDMEAQFSSYDYNYMDKHLEQHCGTQIGNRWWVAAVFNKRMENQIFLFDVDRGIRFEMPYSVKLSEVEVAQVDKMVKELVDAAEAAQNPLLSKIVASQNPDSLTQLCSERLYPKTDRAIEVLAKRRLKTVPGNGNSVKSCSVSLLKKPVEEQFDSLVNGIGESYGDDSDIPEDPHAPVIKLLDENMCTWCDDVIVEEWEFIQRLLKAHHTSLSPDLALALKEEAACRFNGEFEEGFCF